VARIATISLGILSILLGILFKGQNVAFMVGLAFAVAASANFPALLLSIVWKRLTTAGAVASMAHLPPGAASTEAAETAVHAAAPRPEQRGPGGSTFYTVQKGDTLSAIAKRYYGSTNAYMAIFEANVPMLDDPDRIYPGQVLRIPPR